MCIRDRHQDAAIGKARAQCPDQRNPIQFVAPQRKIQQQDVGVALGQGAHQLPATLVRAHHFDVGFGGQMADQSVPHDRMIVKQGNAYAFHSGSGTRKVPDVFLGLVLLIASA